MRALAEEFLLRHLDDGAIGGFLLGLYIATVLFALGALCRRILGGHCEEQRGQSREIQRPKSKLRKSPGPHLLLHSLESLDRLVSSCSRHSTRLNFSTSIWSI